MNLILLGAPGAGKGTQAQSVSDRYQIPAVSTGEILRATVQKGTELGKQAAAYMNAGKLVPDEILIGIVRERLAQPDCRKGFILDGFPRTLPQAEALDRMGVPIDKVIEIEVSDERIVKRMSGRRVCEKCGASYHTLYKPSRDGKTCDIDGGRLVRRADDAPETVRERLGVYHRQTEPLKEYYDRKHILWVVQGREKVADTTKATFEALEG